MNERLDVKVAEWMVFHLCEGRVRIVEVVNGEGGGKEALEEIESAFLEGVCVFFADGFAPS